MSGSDVGTTNSLSANGEHPVEYRRVYVWELPVRAYHWINAIALVALCITGYLIGNPIQAVPIPNSQNVTAIYAGAVMNNAAHPKIAAAWLRFLKTPQAQAIYHQYGFRSLPSNASQQ